MGHLQDINESYLQHLKVTAKVAGRLICAAGCQLIHGIIPDKKAPFNNNLDSLINFLPKGSDANDLVEVVRDPLATRPISRKNTDNKIIVKTNGSVLEERFSKIVHFLFFSSTSVCICLIFF